MVTGIEAAGLALGLFPIVLEGITFYISSAGKVIELIRHKRTLDRFMTTLEVEKVIYDNIWRELGSRVDMEIEPNMVTPPETINKVLSCLNPDTRKSFVNSCKELDEILIKLKNKFEKYEENVVGMDLPFSKAISLIIS